MIKEINSNGFKEILENSDKPVMINFFAERFAPCRMMLPVISQVANEYRDKLSVRSIDVEKNPDIALEYRVLSVPTIIIFRDGKPVGKIEGVTTKAVVDQKLNKYLNI